MAKDKQHKKISTRTPFGTYEQWTTNYLSMRPILKDLKILAQSAHAVEVVWWKNLFDKEARLYGVKDGDGYFHKNDDDTVIFIHFRDFWFNTLVREVSANLWNTVWDDFSDGTTKGHKAAFREADKASAEFERSVMNVCEGLA